MDIIYILETYDGSKCASMITAWKNIPGTRNKAESTVDKKSEERLISVTHKKNYDTSGHSTLYVSYKYKGNTQVLHRKLVR